MKASFSLFRSYLSRAAKAAIEFPPDIQAVITGMIWGDSTLQKDKRNPMEKVELMNSRIVLIS